MTIDRYRNNDPRTAEEVAAAIEEELQRLNSDQPVVVGTQNYAYIQSFSQTLSDQQEQGLADLYDAGYIADATGVELTKKANELGVERRDAVAATGVVEFSRDTNATQDRVIPSGTRVATGGDDSIAYTTIEQTTIQQGTQTAKADIRCTETGPQGNVGANSITVMLESQPGVQSVTNPEPVGDPSYTLTNGQTQLTSGADRESDASLRDRALDTVAIGGAGTAEALELALENEEEIISANVFTNRSGSVVQNVDPWHTEVRVYGGDVDVIADILYDVLPLTTLKSLQGGANGTLNSTTIDGGELYGQLNIPITRPTELDLWITLDIVHDGSYSGTAFAKDAVVEYIGGTTTDGSTVTGLGQGDDVIVSEVENVVEDVTGVVSVTSSVIDRDNDGTDDTVTDSDGVQVYPIDNTEVPHVFADNITINETQR